MAWLRRDPWQAFILLLAAPLTVALLYSIFSVRTPTALPVAWLDEDHSVLSRQLGRQLEASPAIRLQGVADNNEAKAALAQGQVYAVVRIPPGFTAAVQRQQPTQLDVRYNGQYLLLARRLATPLQQAMGSALQQQGGLALAAAGVPAVAVAAQISPVQLQLTALNNRAMDYADFLIPALALAVWQVVLLFAVLNLCQRPPWPAKRALVGVLAWLWLMGGLGLWAMRDLLLLPEGAPLWPLWLGLLPLMVPIATLALLLVRSGREAVQLVSTGAAFLTPAMTYMGVTMPTADMPVAAQWWAGLIPSSHYLPLLQSFRGVGEADWLSLWPLLLPMPLMLWLWSKL
ncbi:ABC transporter permease [Ferrimonas marina]|uniref:ABC-2 type transport system permease protein n=1 Tax=Ferrimonas marina TaxID=299255 RepID=A0A1M5Y1A3_9GAMM|nr:ABC transporter permease [Ferrimonas marina]SHI05782.1 ABC-2 type transport system permease protein [Ferrimonas marina]